MPLPTNCLCPYRLSLPIGSLLTFLITASAALAIYRFDNGSLISRTSPRLASFYQLKDKPKRQAESVSYFGRDAAAQAKRQAEKTSRKDKLNLKLQGEPRFPGRPPGSSGLSAFSFQGFASELYYANDPFWNPPDKPTGKPKDKLKDKPQDKPKRPADRQAQRQDKLKRQPETTRRKTRQKNKPKRQPERRAKKLLSPGSVDASSASLITMASSINDYIEEGDVAVLSFADEGSWDSQHFNQHLSRQQQHLHQHAQEFLLSCEDDDSFFWRLLVDSDGVEVVYLSSDDNDDDSFCSLLYLQQQLQQQQQQRPHPKHPRTVDYSIDYSINPTAPFASGRRRSFYSRSDIRHYFGLVHDSYGPDLPTLGPTAGSTMLPTPCMPIPKTKSWRMPVPTPDNLALYAAYVPDRSELASPKPQVPSVVVLQNAPTSTDTATAVPQAPVFKTSPATPKSYPLLKSSPSEDTTCDTITTTSTLWVDIDSNHNGFGHNLDAFLTPPEEEIIFESQISEYSALADVYSHAFLPTSWVLFVLLGRLPPLGRFHLPARKGCNIGCQRSSLRWIIALIRKLLLIAWDFWQYKID